MKFACMEYRNNYNLGDQIQSLAAAEFLPEISRWIDRDTLSLENLDEPHLLIMQGWFSMTPETSFPPAKNIKPLFFGFHISPFREGYKHFLGEKSIEYFKKNEPVGCRDRQTMNLLQEKGVNAFLSHCLTLSFPTRNMASKADKVILVDAEQVNVPEKLTREAIRVSHRLPSHRYTEKAKLEMAASLLRLYRKQARLVITTRLHCALPCLAMGIPVVFFGNGDDSRVSVLKEVGLPIYGLSTRQGQIDWEPKVHGIDPIRDWIIDTIDKRLRSVSGDWC